MREIEYHYRQEKHEWGEGPWEDEPDKIQFTDGLTGLPCLIVRNRGGALCGYVGVTNDHPLFAVPYNADYADADIDPDIKEMLGGIDVHGGLTFSEFCDPSGDEHGICHVVEPGEDEKVWWLGFDCGHYMDLLPAYVKMFADITEKYPRVIKETYRTIGYVKEEIAGLAIQLKQLGGEKVDLRKATITEQQQPMVQATGA